MPQAQAGQQLLVAAQIPTAIITSDMIATDTIVAGDIAANSVGDSEIAAHTTTKITVPATLFTVANQAQGDIIYFNGTNWVRLAAGTSGQFLKTLGTGANPAWATGGSTYANGVTTRAGDTASGAQNIAHGLGVVPLKIRITATKNFSAGTNVGAAYSTGVFNGTTRSTIFEGFGIQGTTGGDGGTDSTNILVIEDGSSSTKQAATVTIDATNIVLTFTKTGSPSTSNINILWEALG